jgi:hypothetical protein
MGCPFQMVDAVARRYGKAEAEDLPEIFWFIPKRAVDTRKAPGKHRGLFLSRGKGVKADWS